MEDCELTVGMRPNSNDASTLDAPALSEAALLSWSLHSLPAKCVFAKTRNIKISLRLDMVSDAKKMPHDL